MKVAQSVWLFATPWTIQSTRFSRPEYWSGNSLLQGIFPTQWSNPGLPYCRQILYQLSHKGSPRILEWVAYPFSRESSWPRSRTRVSCIAGRLFTNWAMREALSFYSYVFIMRLLFLPHGIRSSMMARTTFLALTFETPEHSTVRGIWCLLNLIFQRLCNSGSLALVYDLWLLMMFSHVWVRTRKISTVVLVYVVYVSVKLLPSWEGLLF